MKKIIMGLAVVAMAILTTAFIDQSSAKEAADAENVHQWFIYTGSDPSGETEASNYEPYEGSGSPTGCAGDDMICAVFAAPSNANPDEPDLTTVDEDNTKRQSL